MPKLCEFENCRKRASYGYTNGSLERCKEHSEDRPLSSRICKCGTHCPSYNEPGTKLPICCAKCKTETMIDAIHKRCKCQAARPTFNEPGETDAICCVKCKTDTMANVKDKRCKCQKAIPTFNEPGETGAICCVKCKTETMIDVIHTLCKCQKARPTFNEPGETVGICCVKCKTETMVNIKDKHCPGQDGMCTTRGNKKYKGYCTFCFQHQFPDDPLTLQIRCKTKELAVRTFIDFNFKGFIHDKQLSTTHCDCTIRRRPDHRIVIGNTILCVEDDENGHKGYSEMDEETRYDDLYMAFSGKWIYIRFNPDKYIDSKGKSKNPHIATRLVALKKEIENQIDRINNEENVDLVERVYMYYDEI